MQRSAPAAGRRRAQGWWWGARMAGVVRVFSSDFLIDSEVIFHANPQQSEGVVHADFLLLASLYVAFRLCWWW